MKKFIVFEGIDGCGKSTQAKLLAAYLKRKGKKVLLTKEPSDHKWGKKIRIWGRKKGAGKITKQEWFRLYTLDRKEHLKKDILPALKKGKIVISDRYYHSTCAYQLNREESKWRSYTRQFLTPNITFIFDVPVRIGLKRIEKDLGSKRKKGVQRKGKFVFEKKLFLEGVRKNYLAILNYLKNENIKVINGTKPVKKIFKEVKEYLKNIL